MVHNNSKGWITKARIISGNFSQWHYKYQELLQEELDGENVYISLNTFFSTYRRVEFLKELKAHFIDLDVYNTKFTKDQIDLALSMLSVNGGDKSYNEVERLIGISVSTLKRENNKRKLEKINN